MLKHNTMHTSEGTNEGITPVDVYICKHDGINEGINTTK